MYRRAMIFRQITHDDLGCASYLVGDDGAGVAAVVDPRFEIDVYLDLARYMGVRIEHVLETHNHADHVSGHGRLALATGATIHVHRLAAPNYEHEPFDDGWELELGDVVIRALHTPGHRPEHTAFALIDRARGEEPWAVLSGDSLFVGDVARPDLAVDRDEGARGIFASLRGPAAGAAGRVRGVARASRRIDVRRTRNGPEDHLHDRLRAPAQRLASRG
jgi:hydroxyacylglutathione hydrolase